MGDFQMSQFVQEDPRPKHNPKQSNVHSTDSSI